MILIDAHAHLDRYEREIKSVLKEISQNKIFTISNSMDLPSYRRNLEISEICEFVLPTFGVHPWNAPDYAGRLGDIKDAVEKSPMIGEIGLDFHYIEDPSHYPDQRRVFEFFLAAAKDQDKIINLHTKGAEREILDLLIRFEIPQVIIHWYSGPLNVFHELVDYGAYFTIGIELAHSKHIITIAEKLPLDQLLTETDNPDGIQWLTGEPGMPLQIRNVVQELAVLKGMTTDTMTQAVQSNFARLIQSNPWLSEIHGKFFAH